MYFLLKNLPVVEISIDSSENSLFEESYPNMSINSSLTSPIKTPDNLLIEIMNDNPVDQSEDDEDESLFTFDWFKQLLIEEEQILEYSLEYGFLRLSPETRKRLNIEVLLITLGKKNFLRQKISYFLFLIKDATNSTCFGSGLSRFMLDQFIGYQEILMSNIKQLAEKETHKGN